MRLASAQAAIAATLAHGAAEGGPPLAVIVLDAGGHPVAYARGDGASLFRFDIARAKAMGALGMGVDSRELAERAAANPAFLTSVAIATRGAMALSAGGVLLRDHAGQAAGAIGVSGATADFDEVCAQAGADAWIQGGL